ncbi:hypothetical protein BH11BAC5_BH11BAC5_22930 [soil metagenome]
MKKLITSFLQRSIAVMLAAFFISSCQKSASELLSGSTAEQDATTMKSATPATPNFNLEVILRGMDNAFGLVKFRQDNDIDKIITLGVWVRDLQPNHEYKLQRAVDTNLDGNCTSTAWLTLGAGLQPLSVFTDETGTGRADLFRSLAAVASGTTFDIHFQVIDVANATVVLTSDCYQFTVR